MAEDLPEEFNIDDLPNDITKWTTEQHIAASEYYENNTTLEERRKSTKAVRANHGTTKKLTLAEKFKKLSEDSD